MKLQVLRSCCTDRAYKVIQHLSLTDTNYDIALELLDNEFMNKDELINEILSQFCNTSPTIGKDYNGIKTYLLKFKADLLNLSNTFKNDLISEHSADKPNAGNLLLSYIILSE